jgi:hypothetical protein
MTVAVKSRMAKAVGLKPSTAEKTIGKEEAVTMEERETYLVVRNTRKKIRTAIAVTFGEAHRKAPKAVATPLPPLRSKKGEKQCPKTANMATPN